MLHIYRQIRALERFRPVVICQKRENGADFPLEDVMVVPKPATHQLRRLWQKQILGRPITIYKSEARRLAETLEEIAASVLHVYFGHIGVHLLPLLEISPVPIIVSFHGADAQLNTQGAYYAACARRVLERAKLVFARSESLLERLAEFGCNPRKLRLHRTGLPLEEIDFHARNPAQRGAWHFVQACRLIEKKGLATTMRAFAAFRQQFPDSTLTVAGEGPLRAALGGMARELRIAEHVRFTGFLSQPDLRALFAASHIFLHPSETAGEGDQEGVPNAMLEAMASGLPVIATRHGGIPEAVEDQVSGLLVKEREHAAVTAAMLRLTREPALYTSMGAVASQRVREKFDLHKQTRLLEELYAEVATPDRHWGKPPPSTQARIV